MEFINDKQSLRLYFFIRQGRAVWQLVGLFSQRSVVQIYPLQPIEDKEVVSKKKESKNPVGRPRAITEDVLQKLKEAFMMGCSKREACLYADVAESTFYDFLKEYPEYSEKIEIWKSYEKIKARMVVHKALDKGDRDMAKWYLERKAKDEFNTKMEIDAAVKDKVKVVIIDDLPDEE